MGSPTRGTYSTWRFTRVNKSSHFAGVALICSLKLCIFHIVKTMPSFKQNISYSDSTFRISLFFCIAKQKVNTTTKPTMHNARRTQNQRRALPGGYKPCCPSFRLYLLRNEFGNQVTGSSHSQINVARILPQKGTLMLVAKREAQGSTRSESSFSAESKFEKEAKPEGGLNVE